MTKLVSTIIRLSSVFQQTGPSAGDTYNLVKIGQKFLDLSQGQKALLGCSVLCFNHVATRQVSLIILLFGGIVSREITVVSPYQYTVS